MSSSMSENVSSNEFHGYILRDAREYKNDEGQQYPVIPDLTDPILAVGYIMEAWANVYSKDKKTEAAKVAKQLKMDVGTVKKQTMIRLSDVPKLMAKI